MAATYAPATQSWSLTFDQPLQADPLSAGQLLWQRPGTEIRLNAGGEVPVGDTIAGTGVPDFSLPAPLTVTYQASPPQLVGTTGLPVAPFVGFPYVVV